MIVYKRDISTITLKTIKSDSDLTRLLRRLQGDYIYNKMVYENQVCHIYFCMINNYLDIPDFLKVRISKISSPRGNASVIEYLDLEVYKESNITSKELKIEINKHFSGHRLFNLNDLINKKSNKVNNPLLNFFEERGDKNA